MLVIVLFVRRTEKLHEIFCTLLSTTEISARSWFRHVPGSERREA